MVQLTNLRFALVTILALGGAFFSDTKNNIGPVDNDKKSPTTNSPESVPADLSPNDWTSIREAYDVNRHSAFPVDGGHRFRNPGQKWNTQFDGRGFLVKPDAGNWSWGLELQSYGIVGNEKPVSKTTNVTSNGQRVLYQWDSNVTEWYKNDTRGLEHGYTVHSRPANSDGLLTFTLVVRGELRPQVQAGGRDVQFVDSSNVSVLNYSGLTVVDVRGKRLPARFESTHRGLRLFVDENDAQYPLTIDPVATQAYVKASNTGSSDHFGSSVAVSGETVVVAAQHERSAATGVNGNQSDNSAPSAGAVYVFVRSGTTWSQQAYLKASNTEAGDQFGVSVAVSGNTIAVGSLYEASNATGVNGNQANNSAASAGAVYVFVRSGTTWSQQAYLKASNTDAFDLFGSSVAISGETIVVGAHWEDSNATGVNGNQLNNSAATAGAAYVFERTGTTWSQQAYLKALNTGTADEFGISVSVSGDTVVVGAWREDSNATGVNGDQTNNSSLNSGAAYVFVRSGHTWSQQAYLKASNTAANDIFGLPVAISGDTIVVAAQNEDSNATGVNGNESNNSASGSGAVYVFVRGGTTWGQQAYLKASNTGTDDGFGLSVAISGNTVVVGTGFEDSDSTGVNGDASNNNAPDSGAAYVFTRIGSAWGQQAYLKASNTETNDWFGWSVGVSGDIIVAGAYQEASDATGVGGDESNNNTGSSGACYIYGLDNNPGISVYGTGTPGCAGTHTLSVNHAPMINSPNFIISCDNAPASSLGLGLITDSPDFAGSDPFALGVLLHTDFALATEIIPVDFFSDATGYSETVGVTIPNNPAVIGVTYYACVLWAWPTSTCTLPGFNPYNLSTSRGLAITVLVP